MRHYSANPTKANKPMTADVIHSQVKDDNVGSKHEAGSATSFIGNVICDVISILNVLLKKVLQG